MSHDSNNIIPFPTGEKAWREAEPAIRRAFKQTGAPIDMEDFVCNRLKCVFLKYDKPFILNVRVPQDAAEVFTDSIDKLVSYFKEYTTALMGEITLREIEIYRLGRQKPNN